MEIKPSDSTSKDRVRHDYRVLHSCQLLLIYVFIAVTFVEGIYRSINRPLEIAFIIFSYSVLILFHWVINQWEEATPERRKKLKVLLWLLPTILALMFTYRVTYVTPLAVKVILWSSAGLGICSTFYVCFLHPDTSEVAGEINDRTETGNVKIVIE